jgi:branched-chain amino acid transport system substrate-binding protein
VKNFFACLAGMMVAIAYSGVVSAQSKESIQIGAFLTMTGKLALLGSLEKNGILMAVEDVNAAGGVNGRPISVAIEDSADSNTTAIGAVRRLLDKPHPALLGTAVGTQLLAVFPIIKEAGIPILTFSGTRKITQVGNPWVFRFSAHDGISKPALVQFAAQQLKIRKAAVVHESDEYGHSGRDLYLMAMKTNGIEPVAVVSVDAGERDLSSHLLRIKNSGAEAIFSQVHDSAMALLIRQAKRLRVTAPHLASSAAGNVTVQSLVSAEEIEGVHFEYFVDPDSDTRPEVKEWVSRYKRKFGSAPDAYVALSYDRTTMLAKVMSQYGIDRAAIQRGLREMSHAGIATEYRADKEQSMNHEMLVMKYGVDKKARLVTRIKIPSAGN